MLISNLVYILWQDHNLSSAIQGRGNGGLECRPIYPNEAKLTFYGVTMTSERLLNLLHNDY